MGLASMKRAAMTFVKEKFPNIPILGAEVGVLHGEHALNILENIPNIKLLYLIDPYELYDEYDEDDAWLIEKARNIAIKKLAPFESRIRWVLKKFEECTIKEIEPLDFIYIDANHAYEYVKKDIALAIQFVKKGGVIGGHDVGALGVARAIKEYSEEKNISFTAVGNQGEGWDWWFINAVS